MARMDVADAVRGAVDAAIVAEEAAQLDMLLPGLASSDRLTTEGKAAIVEAVRRERGRPKGAKNLATRDMLDFVRRAIGDPLEWRARWLMYAPAELAKVLGCSTLEAFDRQDRIAEAIAKLFYAPLAPIDGQGNAVVPRLTMVFGGQHAHAGGAPGEAAPPWIYPGGPDDETLRNQRVIEVGADQSHGQVSHSDGNDSDNSGLDKSGR